MTTDVAPERAAVTPELVFQTATGFMASKHLFAANEVGLFEALAASPLPLEELATRLGIPVRTARITADAMVALGFLTTDDGRYANTPVSQTFLSGATPADLRPFLRFWNHISYPAWHGLEEALRTGERVPREISPENEEIFSRGVAAFTAGPAHALAARYEFGQHSRLLDIGGGAGGFTIPLLERHDGLRATILDLPEVADVARRIFANHALAARVDVVAGNALTDTLPAGHDVVLVANLVHYFDHARNLELLRRLREAVAAGARILLVDFWTDATHTQPPFAALMAGEFLVHQGGDVFSEDEARSWLEQTSWSYLETLPLEGPLQAVVAEAR